MWQELIKAIPVYFSSMVKFIFGPIGGYLVHLNMLTTILVTVAGMMTAVFAFTFFGTWLRAKIIDRFYKNKKKFSVRNRRFVHIWKKYGMVGIAFLTPILLTPIGGTLLAVGFGAPRDKLIIYMFMSASFWSVLFTFIIYMFGKEVLPEFVAPDPLLSLFTFFLFLR